MKFNRSEIMQNAWRICRRTGLPFAQALRNAWYQAKAAVQRWDVYGERIYDGSRERLAKGVTYDEAGHVEWLNKYRFDHIRIVMAA